MTRPAWDTHTAQRPGQFTLILIGCLVLPPGLVAVLLRLFPPVNDVPALIASFIPYGFLAHLVALICFGTALVRSRHRAALGVLSLVSALCLAVQAAWLLPLFVADNRPARDRTFTVLSFNMGHRGSDPGQLAQAARDADLVVLLESTPAAISQLSPFGWDERFPYSLGNPRDLVTNSAVYSRFPLSDTAGLPQTSFQQWIATVSVPHVAEVRLMAVHPCNPFCRSNSWDREHQVVNAVAEANIALPLLMVGDFNAVEDHGPMQELHAMGLRSVTDLVGAGWLPTYPAGSVVPPLLPIDHLLVNNQLTGISIERVSIDGSDHYGVKAVITAVPG